MRHSRARNLALATAFTSALAVTSSDVPNSRNDLEFEGIFTKERAESAISGTAPTNGRELLMTEIRPLLSEKRIVRGDTPAALAGKHQLAVEEFVSLNRMFSAPSFSGDGKTPVLRIGEAYYVPTDPSAIRPYFSKLSRLERADRVAEAIRTGANVKKIRHISGEAFFPKEPECLGLGEVLSSMVAMQEREFDPLLPVIVDPRIEHTASCANLIKNTFIQACNLKYYTDAQRKMLLTQDLHAWILVKKLRDEFGYEQSHASLMKAFNLDAFFSFNPITDPAKRAEYDAEIREVYAFLRDSAPQGTIVPMYFQGSRSKPAVMGEYRKSDPHLNTHQTMFAGNIDWRLRASEVPVVRDGKRLPFGHDPERAAIRLADAEASVVAAEARLASDREAVLASLDPVRNPDLVPHVRTVPQLLANAFRDPKFDAYLKSLPASEVAKLPAAVTKKGTIDRDAFAEMTRERIRTALMDGNLTVEALRGAVSWYKMPESDVPMFEARLAHAASLAKKRREAAVALATGKSFVLAEFGPTVAGNVLASQTANAYNKASSDLDAAKRRVAELRAALSTPNDVSRTAVDFLVDFIASRADFPSSFFPNFRNTVLSGLARYPDLVEIEVNGKKLDVAAELAAVRSGKPSISVRPSDEIRLTGPVMLDGEIQATSDDAERRERMNARTRFLFEFLTTIYLPTEVLTPGEDTLPSRQDFDVPEAELLQKYVYSLRKGETLASVLKSRIIRYEGIRENDPRRTQKIAEYLKWQFRALKMDGFLQTESEFNPGAVNENRIIPYYDVRTVPAVWYRYLAERRTADLEFEKSVALPYLRISTIDGAGIDSKRKLFREILARIEASETRLSEYPALREVAIFNEFQYELFMKRFFERSRNDSEVAESSDFFRDVRPNRNFYIRYGDLAEIAAEISDAAGLEIPELKAVDAAVINSVVKNRFNASLVKNILVTETYSVDGRLGFRKASKRVREILPFFGNNSHGDFQIRVAELSGSFVKDGRVVRLDAENREVPLEWPTLKNLRDSVSFALREETLKFARTHLEGPALARFVSDANQIARVREILGREDVSASEMLFVKGVLVSLMRIDPGDASNLIGKTFSTALLDTKISLHFRKTSYWLPEMGVPFEYLADSDEERSKFDRVVALVNNLSEDKVLLALTENYVIRILSGAFGVALEPEDVYARPKNPVKKLKQELARQLDYDRSKFFVHFANYLEKARETVSREEYLAKRGVADMSDEKLAQLKETIALLSKYAEEMANSKNFNADAFRLLRDPAFREILSRTKLPWTPFPSVAELSNNDFGASVFNYVIKMEKRKKAEPAKTPSVLTQVDAFLRQVKK